jgi:(1->4)-alpha-D-glucan 1-alpha-D-glucosylmutase
MAAQLYGLRSERNWGIGDFTDLKYLVAKAAECGVDVIGLNPLHALFPEQPENCSPYAPSNRLFLNFLYLDVEAIEGFKEISCDIHPASLRQVEQVDYRAVAEAKRQVMEVLFQWFRRYGNHPALENFREQQAENLEDHCIFDALCEYFRDASWWGEWPEEFRNPRSAAVRRFAEEHSERVEFFAWLQWQTEQQLASVQALAKEKGMVLGLYRDLAVGSGTNGAEVWRHQESFVRQASVGAPPDEYNQKGQNWGLPPLNPVALQELAFEPFIELVRANMRHAGALRIDHAFGLSRLFWVPEETSPAEGAYVHYPFEELLAILKIESHRNQCLVIGEDLGTFPPNYKEGAAKAGLLSYRILFFERTPQGEFLPPETYPALALATFSTHDLPTFQGWLQDWDIDEREKLDLYPSPEMIEKDRKNRDTDRKRLAELFRQQALPETSSLSAHRFLARSPALLVMVQLEDILGVAEQANMPGTVTEHPNWKRKLPTTLETLFAEDSPVYPLAEKMRAERERQSPARPLATYRLQFHKDFTFKDAIAILPYLAKLGISHVYCSPWLMSRPGSIHGYDMMNHNAINPELGGEEGYQRFVKALKENGLKQILDFVPNHMGTGDANAWWKDVLRHGPASPYASFFDIDWQQGDKGEAKLVLPVLGKPYGEALESGELILKQDGDGWHIHYFDHRFPVNLQEGEGATSDFQALHAILERQHYRLAYWRVAAHEINYRRFFEINELAGIRIEEESVFRAVHEKITSLIQQEEIDGLRIDHVDGLAYPAAYLRRLQRAIGPNRYVIVEKILGPTESLRQPWPVAGTTGYEVMAEINNILVDSSKEEEFSAVYQRFTGYGKSFHQTVYEAKLLMLDVSFAGELNTLARLFHRIASAHPSSRDYTLELLREGLRQVIACFPVYRTYRENSAIDAEDTVILQQALENARQKGAQPDDAIYHFIEQVLIGGIPEEEELHLLAVRRFQQLTSPVTAKGVEDTSFYRYLRLVSLNEVGNEPEQFGISPEVFHQRQQERQRNWPGNLIATATHDTKRGEDMRARINVLSEIPEIWEGYLLRWQEMNQGLRGSVSPNDEYLLYQTLLGSWPLELLKEQRLSLFALHAYRDRIQAYMQKAVREAKLHSSWLKPEEAYEADVKQFIESLLAHQEFLDSFLLFAKKIAHAGAFNSLAQTVLKFTLPGVPDIYQGCEGWDFSLVDPDNRRPVDYPQRKKALDSQKDWQTLLAHWQDGAIKQKLVQSLLNLRKNYPALFMDGEYLPLAVTGKRAGQVIAFLRRKEEQALMVIIPRLIAAETMEGRWLQENSAETNFWEDTMLLLPDDTQRKWKSAFAGQKEFFLSAAEVPLAPLMNELPFSVMFSE